MALNNQLLNNNYLVIDNLISAEQANVIYKDFKKFCDLALFGNFGDSQAPKSPYVYNYHPFLEILIDKIPVVKEYSNESVFPTYTYGRIYKHNEELKIHTDREACEISISLHLWGDKEWPFCIRTSQGETKEIFLNPGQAVLYLGCAAEHWRPKFYGYNYGQVFLHYVRSNGPNAWAYFDKIKKPQ